MAAALSMPTMTSTRCSVMLSGRNMEASTIPGSLSPQQLQLKTLTAAEEGQIDSV
jgi:hypothetical protein